MRTILALLLAPLWQNKSRLMLAVLAIALGVALGYAVQLINRSAVGEFAQALQTLSGSADLSVVGPRTGFDESIYPMLAALPEVAAASPMVEVDAQVAGREESLGVVGLDVFRAARIQPLLLAETESFLDTLRADTLFLSPAAREWLQAEQGDTVALRVGLQTVPMRVAGLLRADGTRQRLAVMDIGAAQWRLDRLGKLTRVELKLRPGVDLVAAEQRIGALLPAGVHVERREQGVRSMARLTRAYRINLNVLALVALFTGGLLVLSTQALSVARRRAQLALLRVLGVTRRGAVALLVWEGALVGAVGAGLGVALGYMLAGLVLRFVGADLGAGHFRGVTATPALEPAAAAVFFGLGVAVSVLGSLLPALEAVRESPARALKAGDDARAFARLAAPWPGVVLLVLGAAVAFLPAIDGLPLFGYVAIALLLLGTIALMPRLLRMLLRLLPVPAAISPALAQAQLANAPGPASISLASIVAAVSLTVSMAIMVASFRQSLTDWLDHVLPADLYLRASGAGNTAYFPIEMQRRIAALPGVRRAEFLRSEQIMLESARPRISLLVRAVDPASPQDVLPLVGTHLVPPAAAPPPVWVSELMVDVYGFSLGQVVAVPIAGRAEAFTVAGVWRDYARQNGAIVIERDLYIRLTGDTNATDAGLWLEPGVAVRDIEQRVREQVASGDQLEIAQPGAIRRLSLGIFDRSFAVTYALEAAAIVIGLFGLSSGLASHVLARRREFGVLRHIGMTRLQVGAMLAAEGVFTSGVGLMIGSALGWVISLILIHVVNRQSFHWSMALHIPWLALTAFCSAMLLLATLTAVLSGRQAMSADVIRAVKEDW